ncbi:hypothetical protein DOY81_013958 [Sarcophaga bullata]|nr:hypothetical protein DOY81_013958 [Sarcophaga bullata]
MPKLLGCLPRCPAYSVSSNYWILDTDYSTYTVVYSCQPLGQQSTTLDNCLDFDT